MSDRMRFAIYVRYSSEIQSEKSLEEQEFVCREEIARRDADVVMVYKDAAQSGWSLDRDGFNAMRQDAEKSKFDAIMMWRFDRLARDSNHALMLKTLLRHEYGVKLYCVDGYSEDDDESSYIEQMLAVFSAFYSHNLSKDAKRSKRLRVLNGEFNGSFAPIGYDLVTVGQASTEKRAGLHINPAQADIVRAAFQLYTSGEYSDGDIAKWFNQQPLIQAMRTGKKPIDKEFVREMLQNRVYTGRVCHTDTRYTDTLGKGRKSSRGRREWFEGRHHGFISDELFERCQEVRKGLRSQRHNTSIAKFYLLRNKIFCARCLSRKPDKLHDGKYGKMRAYFHNQLQYSFYRCSSTDRGYGYCGQKAVDTRVIDAQVIAGLSNSPIPASFYTRVEKAIQNRMENELAARRMREIQTIIERIDFSWESGFMDRQTYIDKRRQLQEEIKALNPVDYDSLTRAADILKNFSLYWQKCDEASNPELARQELIDMLVDRVYIQEKKVVKIILRGDYELIIEDTIN